MLESKLIVLEGTQVKSVKEISSEGNQKESEVKEVANSSTKD